jgi:hypothetical protein
LTGEFNLILQADAGLKNNLDDGREEEPTAEKREAVAHEANSVVQSYHFPLIFVSFLFSFHFHFPKGKTRMKHINEHFW